MPVNGFSVGRDLSVSIMTPAGALRPDLITAFSAKPDTVEIKTKGLDGVTRHLRFPDGWSGSMMVDRKNGVLDSYFADVEANYYAGLDEKASQITQTIAEADGSVSQYRFVGVLLTLTDGGEWAGAKQVSQSVSFVAERRVKVA